MIKNILILILVSSILLLTISICCSSPIKRVETQYVDGNVEYIYVNERTKEYIVTIEFGGATTTFNDYQFYLYCEPKLRQTIPCVITLTFYNNHNVSYELFPDLESIT